MTTEDTTEQKLSTPIFVAATGTSASGLSFFKDFFATLKWRLQMPKMDGYTAFSSLRKFGINTATIADQVLK